MQSYKQMAIGLKNNKYNAPKSRVKMSVSIKDIVSVCNTELTRPLLRSYQIKHDNIVQLRLVYALCNRPFIQVHQVCCVTVNSPILTAIDALAQLIILQFLLCRFMCLISFWDFFVTMATFLMKLHSF